MNLDKKKLNVFFTVDNNYLIHFTVALTSLLENNKDLDVSVYIIHDLTDTLGMDKIIGDIKEKYDVKLHLTTLDNSVFDNFHLTLYSSKAVYFRLLFADIIPDEVSSGLYLDCDLVVTGSLEEFTRSSFKDAESSEEFSILAVADKKEDQDIERLKNLGIETKMYFNSGVMFINLEKWREDGVSSKLIKIGQDYKEHLVWWDQDVLNIHFRNNCGKLNPKYNSLHDKMCGKIPIIIHYTGSSKPWHYFDEHPYKYIYWEYLKLSIFNNERFEKITFRKFLKKYRSKFMKKFGF